MKTLFEVIGGAIAVVCALYLAFAGMVFISHRWDRVEAFMFCPAIDTRPRADGSYWVGPRYYIRCEYLYLNSKSEPIGQIVNLYGSGERWHTFIEHYVHFVESERYFSEKDIVTLQIGRFDSLEFAARDVEWRGRTKTESE